MIQITLLVAAQRQANTWYFGNKVGLDFNYSVPQVLHNFNLNSLEGCAIISDNNGKVLFYTNGLVVSNRKNVTMKNGNGLMGDLSSTSNAMIIPLPGNDSIYYLFTVGAQNQSTKGFRYNIIDMKKDSGYGEVIQKNVLLENEVFEKIAAVQHCNKKDVWITVRNWNLNEYHSYLITASGINTIPVASPGSFIPANPIGTLKFSSDGKKLAAVYSFQANEVELMDFDKSTGMLTNPVTFKPDISPSLPDEALFIKAYGAEFSPNSKILYISSNNSLSEPCTLYQFNIVSNNAAAIFASRQIISQTYPFYAGALQIGPDLKIYMARWTDTALSVIENPDILGMGCNFRDNKIAMTGTKSPVVQFGLPNFMQSYFDPTSFYDFNRSGNCADRDVKFSINRLQGIDSVKWDFGDGNNSTLLSPVNHYTSDGYYAVSLVIYKSDCSGVFDTVRHKIWIAETANGFLGADTGTCSLANLQIGINDVTDAGYTWNTGAETNHITTGNFGAYWFRIEQNGCTQSDTINVFEKTKPYINLGKDTAICNNQQVVLNSGSAIAGTYLWSTGESASSITINKTGTYYVALTNNSCTVSDTVVVFPGDCEIFIPNSFTPNKDGINDYFGIANNVAVQDFSMKIYNRYGQVIFSTKNISDKWDGTYKGKAMPVDAYPWSVIYINGKGYTKWLKGTVLILH